LVDTLISDLSILRQEYSSDGHGVRPLLLPPNIGVSFKAFKNRAPEKYVVKVKRGELSA
jgi:hypothetical protein